MTTYGGIYFPQNASVRVVFDGALLYVSGMEINLDYADLPVPSKRLLQWHKKIVTKEGYLGNTFYRDYGYKPTLELIYDAPSDSDIGNLVKVANYQGAMTVFPFFDGVVGSWYAGYKYTLRMKLIEADSEPFGGKNIMVRFKLKFESTSYISKMLDPDALVCIMRGAYLEAKDPDGLGPPSDKMVPMFVRPLARSIEIAVSPPYPAIDRVFCVQNTFN